MITQFYIIGIALQFWAFVSGQQCRLANNRETGVCKKFSICSKAQQDFRLQGIRPSICYFDRYDPVVCCIEAKTTQTTRKTNPTQATRRTTPTQSTRKTTPTQATSKTTLKPTVRPNDNLTRQRISEQKCLKFYSKSQSSSTSSLQFRNKNDGVYYPSVVGGELTLEGEFPYMAAIGLPRFTNEIEFKCGGFLISKNFVITAGHCSSFGGTPPTVVLTGGDPLNKSLSSSIVPIERIYVHPKYKKRFVYNDIAIIKLAKNSIHTPACLWQTKDVKSYSEGTAIGYGHIQFAGKGSNELMKVNLKLYTNSQCSQYYDPEQQFPQGVIESQICAGDPNGGKDTCQGDSGGPLVVKKIKTPYVIGLTSFGAGCAGQAPSIYTRVSSYLDWIESIVWPN